jgi:hypothetical protein
MTKYKNNIREFKKRDNTLSSKITFTKKSLSFYGKILNYLAPRCILCEKRILRVNLFVKIPITLCFVCCKNNSITLIREYLLVPFRTSESIVRKLNLEKEYLRNGEK